MRLTEAQWAEIVDCATQAVLLVSTRLETAPQREVVGLVRVQARLLMVLMRLAERERGKRRKLRRQARGRVRQERTRLTASPAAVPVTWGKLILLPKAGGEDEAAELE